MTIVIACTYQFRHEDYVLAYEEIAYEFDNLETITSGKRSGWLKDSFCVYILSKLGRCDAALDVMRNSMDTAARTSRFSSSTLKVLSQVFQSQTNLKTN